jgi:hypothetical protein
MTLSALSFEAWEQLKEAHDEAVLLFRCGDRWHAFNEDALVCHEYRPDMEPGEPRCLMYGRLDDLGLEYIIPGVAFERYIKRLNAQGYAAAAFKDWTIQEQLF